MHGANQSSRESEGSWIIHGEDQVGLRVIYACKGVYVCTIVRMWE
jgi:hypothetical protein